MKRMCLVGAAVAAGSLAFGVTSSVAAKHHKKKPATITVKASCKLNLAVTVPAGQTAVTPPVDQGTEYGPASCSKIGGGLYGQSFSTSDTGDLVGKFKQFDGAGSIRGTFDLTESDSSAPPSAYSFGNGEFTGTLVVKGGSGLYRKAKGTGTLDCVTDDSVHFACTEKLTLKLPVG